MVHARLGQSKVEVLGVKSCSFEGLLDDAAAEIIRGAIRELKAQKATALIAIDTQAIITKNIEIPSVEDKEIREIIDLQAGRYTPYARDEILVDYLSIDTYHNSYTKVFIVIAVLETLKKQISLLGRAGILVSKIQFSGESVGCACARLLGIASKATPSVVITVDAKTSDFIVIYKGRTIFVRSLPIGWENFTSEAKDVQVQFLEEAKKTLEVYRSEDIESTPDEVFLVGYPEKVDVIKSELAQSLGVPTRAIQLSNYIAVPEAIRAEKDIVSHLNMISSIVAFSDTRIDLRPSELKMKIAFQERSKEIIKTGMFLMTIIVLVCALFLTKIYYRNLYSGKLDDQIKKVESEVKTLETKLTKIMIIRHFIDQRKNPFEVLSRLYEMVPDTVYIRSISVNAENLISIKATASAMSEVFSFVTTVEGSKYFKDAKASNTTTRKESGKDVVDFDLTVSLKSPEDTQQAAQPKTQAEKQPKAPETTAE
jgi:Tfp pilus assembly PilM family ATPase/Tfp pilus assembly protein PilN